MPAKAEQICARIAAAITGATAAGAAVHRDRETAIAREEPLCILIEAMDEDTEPFGLGADQDTLRVAVIHCVRGANWQTQADTLRTQAHAVLVADATLAGLVANMQRDKAEWKAANTDQPFGYCAQVYRLQYLTRSAALHLSP